MLIFDQINKTISGYMSNRSYDITKTYSEVTWVVMHFLKSSTMIIWGSQ